MRPFQTHAKLHDQLAEASRELSKLQSNNVTLREQITTWQEQNDVTKLEKATQSDPVAVDTQSVDAASSNDEEPQSGEPAQSHDDHRTLHRACRVQINLLKAEKRAMFEAITKLQNENRRLHSVDRVPATADN